MPSRTPTLRPSPRPTPAPAAAAAHAATVAASTGRAKADRRAVADPPTSTWRLVLRREPGGSSGSRGRVRGGGGDPVRRRRGRCGPRTHLGSRQEGFWKRRCFPGGAPGRPCAARATTYHGEAGDVVADAAADNYALRQRRRQVPEGGIVVAYEVAVPSLSEAEAVSSTISSTTVEDVDAGRATAVHGKQ